MLKDENKTIIYPTGSYGGEALDKVLTLTYNDNDMYKHGLVHVQTGVKYKLTLPTSRSGKVIQEAQATPTIESGRAKDNGFNSYKITERVLQPEHFGIFKIWNPEVMAQYWKQFSPLGTQVFRELSPAIQADFINQLTQVKNEEIGEALWLGVKDGEATLKSIGYKQPEGCLALGTTPENMPEAIINTKFDGLMARIIRSQKAENELDRVVVGGVTKLETGEAVEKAFNTLHRGIKDSLRSKTQSMKFLVSWDLWLTYDEYLTQKTVKYADNTVENIRKYKGISILPIHGCPEHTIVLGEFTKDQSSNFWMAIDWADPTDESTVEINRLNNYSSEWFVKMHMKMDTNIVKPSEMSVWSIYCADVVAKAPAPGGEGSEE